MYGLDWSRQSVDTVCDDDDDDDDDDNNNNNNNKRTVWEESELLNVKHGGT